MSRVRCPHSGCGVTTAFEAEMDAHVLTSHSPSSSAVVPPAEAPIPQWEVDLIMNEADTEVPGITPLDILTAALHSVILGNDEQARELLGRQPHTFAAMRKSLARVAELADEIRPAPSSSQTPAAAQLTSDGSDDSTDGEWPVEHAYRIHAAEGHIDTFDTCGAAPCRGVDGNVRFQAEAMLAAAAGTQIVPEAVYEDAARAMLPWDEAMEAGVDLFAWHRCDSCPLKDNEPCSCSGTPYPSVAVRAAADAVWAAALSHSAAEVERLRGELERSNQSRAMLAQTIAACPEGHHDANLAHARAERDRLRAENAGLRAKLDEWHQAAAGGSGCVTTGGY